MASQLTTPLDKLEALPSFEGRPTKAVSLELRGVNGGLNDGLTIDPIVRHIGDEVYVLCKGRVEDVAHPRIPDDPDGGVKRAHIIKVTEGVVVDEAFATDSLADMRSRVEAARGNIAMDLDGKLQAAHDEGEHAEELVPGCPACEDEKRLEAAGD